MRDRTEGISSRNTIAIGVIFILIVAVIVAVLLALTAGGIDGVGGGEQEPLTEQDDAGLEEETYAEPDIDREADLTEGEFEDQDVAGDDTSGTDEDPIDAAVEDASENTPSSP